MALAVVKQKEKLEYNDNTPLTHTLSPILTGSSVIGVVYKDGVMIGTDTLVSYGSMARFRDIQRIESLNNCTMIASTGEFSDFQEILVKLKEMSHQDFLQDDNVTWAPRDYGNYLARVNYQRRNKFNPNYINTVIGGYQNNTPYLATVDLYGTYLESNYCLTGFADYMCKPIITNYWNPQCDEATAKKIIFECYKNLFYRDARANDRIQIAICNNQGYKIENPVQVESQWNFKGYKDRANEKLYQIQ